MKSMTREYKNSDIEWYDGVPVSWKKVKIGWLFNLIASGTTPPSNNPIYYDGGIPWLNTGDLKDGEIESTTKTITKEAIKEYSTLKLYPKDSLVMAMYGATIGKLGITKFETTTNQACCVMAHPNNTDSKFIFYWLMGNRKEIINLSQGGGQPNINQNIIKNLKLYLPSYDEQQAITKYLDNKTSDINSLIADKEKLIELLEEKRQAIIFEAVTKGLSPNVKMKDSGVEWIGEIPEHWEVKKIKHLTSVKRGASPRPIDNPIYFDEYGEYAWVRIADVTKSKMYLESTEQRLSSLGSKLSVKLQAGSMFLSIAGTVGKPCITNIKCCIHDGFVYFPEYNGVIKYLYFIFASGEPYKGLGKMGTQLNLNTDTVGMIHIPFPSKEEQEIIVKYIEEKVIETNSLINKIKYQVEKLKEYRQSLIYEAVTGKLDVREYKKVLS